MRSILLIFFVLCVTKMPVNAQILFDHDWQAGFYADTAGHRVTGLLYHQAPAKGLFSGRGDHILYKKDKDSDRKKIFSDTLKCFVIGADSFVVSHFADLENHPFLLVMVNGPIKLYYSSIARTNYTSTMVQGPSTTSVVGGHTVTFPGTSTMRSTPGGTSVSNSYFYGPDPDHVTEIDRKTFIEVMSKIMADKPDVVDLIKNKTYRFSDMDNLVALYNRGRGK